MSNVANPTRRISDVILVLETDPNGTPNYHGASPQGAKPPFRVVTIRPPMQIARGLAGEDWGKLRAHYAILCYGKTVDQAEELRRQTMALTEWKDDWQLLDDGLITGPDPVPNPVQYFCSFEIEETG